MSTLPSTSSDSTSIVTQSSGSQATSVPQAVTAGLAKDELRGEVARVSEKDLDLSAFLGQLDEANASLQPARKYDIMRDSFARYLGYSNEVGESFRSIAPKYVRPSYVLAYGYAFTDALLKGLDEKQFKDGRPIASFVDTMIWQCFASVLLPGLTINRIVHFTSLALAKTPLPASQKKWIPVVAGLAAIPAIIHPIDDFVESMMTKTVRKVTNFTPRNPHKFHS